MKRQFILSILFFSFCINVVFAQSKQGSLLKKRIVTDKSNITIAQLFQQIETQLGISFSFTNKFDSQRIIELKQNESSLRHLLAKSIPNNQFKYILQAQKVIIVPLSPSEKRYTIKGFVFDAESGESLIGAHILIPNKGEGTISNSFGFYSFTVPANTNVFSASYVGYSDKNIPLKLTKDTTINIFLNPKKEIGVIDILAKKKSNITNLNSLSTFNLDQNDIEKAQATFGETDLFKGLQLLPGIQADTEASSGLVVRGGSPDQNLILLDDVPVYYVGHVLGIFSIFNKDAIKKVKFIKGGFPAQYGGRVSSVCDIRLKDGDSNKLHGDFSLGLVSTQFNLHGPLKKGKTTFHFSVRRTYLDLFLAALLKIAKTRNDIAYYFGDISFKVKHKIDANNQLFGSIYYGGDKLKLTLFNTPYPRNYEKKTRNEYGWGNFTSSIRWNHIFNKKLFSNTSLIFSKYRFISNDELAINRSNTHFVKQYKQAFKSGITDLAIKTDFEYHPIPSHSFKFGLGAVFHEFNPGKDVYFFKNKQRQYHQPNITFHSYELFSYIENSIKINHQLSANLGARLSGINTQNLFTFTLEPRFSTRYQITPTLNFTSGYSLMTQNLHRVTQSLLALPIDIWLPTTKKIKPIKSNQITAGVSKTFLNNKYKLSAEASYKNTQNILEFSQNFNATNFNDSWENKVTSGQAKYRGLEFLAMKNRGKWQGFVSYTLSKSKWYFPDLNKGIGYYSPYDRRHNINLNFNKKFSPRVSVSATWQYASGAPTTLQLRQIQTIDPHLLNNTNYPNDSYMRVYDQRNSYRMAAFHRLNLGLKLTKKRKKGTRIWEFNIYNVYWNKNPLFLKLDYTSDGYKIRQTNILGTVPSFRYTYKF